MSRKRHAPEEIVAKLRQVDVLVAQGQTIDAAARLIGVTLKRSAACRHDRPASTAARTRKRRSKDSGLGMRAGEGGRPAS